MSDPDIVLTLIVVTNDQTTAVKAWEVIGRTAIGLALDGVMVSTNVGTTSEEDEDASG